MTQSKEIQVEKVQVYPWKNSGGYNAVVTSTTSERFSMPFADDKGGEVAANKFLDDNKLVQGAVGMMYYNVQGKFNNMDRFTVSTEGAVPAGSPNKTAGPGHFDEETVQSTGEYRADLRKKLGQCFEDAHKVWEEHGGQEPTPEALQATAATLFIKRNMDRR